MKRERERDREKKKRLNRPDVKEETKSNFVALVERQKARDDNIHSHYSGLFSHSFAPFFCLSPRTPLRDMCARYSSLTLKSTIQFDNSVIRFSTSANQADSPSVEG